MDHLLIENRHVLAVDAPLGENAAERDTCGDARRFTQSHPIALDAEDAVDAWIAARRDLRGEAGTVPSWADSAVGICGFVLHVSAGHRAAKFPALGSV